MLPLPMLRLREDPPREIVHQTHIKMIDSLTL
jgi:hypothetical protein